MDDLTGTVLAGHHQPLRVWVLCLFFMGLNLSNWQIALELDLIQRGGQVVLRMLANVQQRTIKPIIEGTVTAGRLVHTEEYGVYARLDAWGFRHKAVCHGRDEYARDEDGDGFCEVHVNTVEGFWSLLRSWLRPHRGLSQDKLPLYRNFLQFMHNARRRGRALLGALVAALVRSRTNTPETDKRLRAICFINGGSMLRCQTNRL